MLIIEKNKLYEEIKKEKKKIIRLEELTLHLLITLFLFMGLVGILLEFFFVLTDDFLNYAFMLLYSTSIFLILLILFIRNKNVNKIIKIKKDLEEKFNEIYEPNNFEKVSEEIILLDQNNNINLINENLIEDLINHKKESETKKSKLDIFKKNSQEIENT